MFQKFDEDTKKVLKMAKYEMQELKHSFVGSEHLLLSILSNKDLDLTIRLNSYNINYENFKETLINLIGVGNSLNSYFIYTPLLKRIIENAILDSKEDNRFEVNLNDLFLSFLDEGEGVGIRVLTSLGINIDDLYLDFINIKPCKGKSKKKLSLYEWGYDLVQKALENKIDPVIGRDQEINRLIEILLRRTKNNPLLLGEAGVGKTAIVEGLALKISNKSVPPQLLNKKIISLSLASLVAGTKYRGEFEDKVNKIISELEENPDLILFIDEIHSLVGAGGAEGAIDAANIFKPALARGKLKLIGATTLAEYKDTIEKDKALARRFQTVLIKEPSLEETKIILKKLKPIYENYHQVIIKNDIIDNIVKLTNKYIYNRKNPDKSIDILDEVCIYRSLTKDKKMQKKENILKELDLTLKEKNNYLLKHDFKEASKCKNQELILEDKLNELQIKENDLIKKEVSINDVLIVINKKTNIPIYSFNTKNVSKLQKLEKDLNKVIIGQEEAIKVIVKETKLLKFGLKSNEKPVSYLFTGSSGIGKTELVKEYARLLNMPLIRIDGSEYKENHSISKILGSPPGYVGYDNHISLIDDIKTNPFSIILVDEIEKSCNSFLNLFLQLLDEGFITTSTGEKVYFNNSIIIFTSNITTNTSMIGFNQDKEKVIKDKLTNILSIELLNRINHVIQFNKLTEDNIRCIIKNKIMNIKNKFKDYNIVINISNNFIDNIIKLSNYKEYGARKINKLLEEKIDDIVIDSILNNEKKVKIS